MEHLRLHQRLAAEVLTSQERLEDLGNSVSLFGGSRVKKDSVHYGAARETARLLSEAGLSIITGGGPGIMEAGNEGARLGKNGKSIGLVITLPFEEKANTHLDVAITFEHFASRKVTFCRYSRAFIFFPGGMGTLDEFGEVLALLTTDKMPQAPVLMYDSQFWRGMVDWMRATMVQQGLVSAKVVDSLIFIDHPQDVLDQIQQWQATQRDSAVVGTAAFHEAIKGSGLGAVLRNRSIKVARS